MSTWQQESPLGTITVEVSEAGIRRIDLTGPDCIGARSGPAGAPASAHREPAGGPEGAVASALDSYFAGDLGALADLPVDLAGRSRFSAAVLDTLRKVPPGAVTTYAEVALAVGRPAASRAVGQAVGANPVLLVVPCHRVVASGGGLGGFSGGLDRKRWLLGHEGAVPLSGGWERRRRHR